MTCDHYPPKFGCDSCSKKAHKKPPKVYDLLNKLAEQLDETAAALVDLATDLEYQESAADYPAAEKSI